MATSPRKYTAAQLVQMPDEDAYEALKALPEAENKRLWGEIYDLNFKKYGTLIGLALSENLNRNVLAENPKP